MAAECACDTGVPSMFQPQPIASPSQARAIRAGMLLACTAWVALPRAEAHGLSEASKKTMSEGGILEYIWLGAEHMVTGYDHLLFLFGVLFFLTGFKDVVRFITAFTVGHCITLLGATLAGITANAYLIDAVIALSVVYKGFENLDGFKKYFSIRAPNLLVMVFIFGLIHGFGLSTRLQELSLGDSGLISRILAFNVGVELGQVAALSVMIAFFTAWRSSQTFERFGRVANTTLVLAGVGLFVFQVNGYFHGHEHDAHHAAEVEAHGAEDHHDAQEAHGHDEDSKAPDDETHE
ncbi:MAG: HupE/UreJ family protein, partial [Myxococcota bacterium]|nr:HupE/UreJ family protein [Myxococcota bacterium]